MARDRNHGWLFLLAGILLWLALAWGATGSVTMRWIAPTLDALGNPLTDLNGYRIYRCAGSGCTTSLFASPAGLGTMYTDATITLGTIYRYQVTAVNTTGVESSKSNIIEIGPPPAPTNVNVH